AAMDLETPAQRLTGLRMLISQRPRESRDALPVAIAREPDPSLRSAEIPLLPLYLDPTTASIFEKELTHADARVRAAAIDALGILHDSAFPIGGESTSNMVLADESDPASGIIVDAILLHRDPAL